MILERGREGEREGEKDQCERETWISCLSHAPPTGAEYTIYVGALTWNRTSHLLVYKMTLNQVTRARAGLVCLSKRQHLAKNSSTALKTG